MGNDSRDDHSHNIPNTSGDILAIDTEDVMLPTPAKTPRKKAPHDAPALKSAARILFPGRLENVEEAMPKGKTVRKHVGFSVGSSGEDEDEETKIQIFTDSKEKIPEVDRSEDNPFYEKRKHEDTPFESSKLRGARKRKAEFRLERQVDEGFNRDEGMMYVL